MGNKEIKKEKNKLLTGFTLVELAAAMVIFGILVSIVVAGVGGVREKARIAAGLQFSQNIKNGIGDELVGEWSFENNLYDSSGNGNNCDWSGAGPTYLDNTASDNLGVALNFNGSSNAAICGSSPSLNISGDEITIEAWIYKQPSTGTRYVLAKSGANWWSYQYALVNYGKYIFLNLNGKLAGNSGEVISDNRWYHVTVTYNRNKTSNQVRYYINGAEVSSANYSTPITPNNYPLRIGRGGMVTAYFFKGNLDEIRIYGKSLTLAQIQQHYVEGAKKKGLLAEK
ncbi:prepilin-type N-terminal cleavage/methylation domain-containing protein [Patescibacteria group bacterium]|nr:prepilin-type N-terminal cleavage/methylation domain-containing protein [Patescibacteria group bacterium]